MRKFTRAFWALLAAGLFAGIARADVFDVQRITAYGYRVLQPSGALGPIHPLGQGDLAVTISPENGFVYRAAATADSNQNRFRAEIPFGYRISRWMARYDSDRLDGSDIANSHGQPEIVVDWDGLGNMINLILVVEEDPIRHVTFAKSQFGEGTLWLDDGKNRHQVEPGVTNVTNGVSYDLEAVPATDPATGLNRSEFRRWEDGSTNYLRLVTIRSNETFCAEFMPSSWPVTFDPDAPEAVVRPRSKVVTWNSSYGKLPTPSRVGHEFVRWETPAGDRAEPSTKVLVAGPHVLQAVWKAVRHVITTLVEGSGTVEGGGTKDYGSMVELKAKPAEGHSFVGWDDGVTDNPRVLNVVGDAVYTALFSPCLYTVTFNYRGPNGEKKTEIRSDVRYHGHVDPPDPGAVTNWANHTFVAWDRSFERIESDLTVTAVYNAGTYFVRFEPNGGEGVMDTVAIMIDEDEALPPNTFTRERFHFLGWSEQAEATRAQYADKEVVRNIADENATNVLYAVWAHNLAYTIVYDANGGEGGTNQYVEIGSLSYLWGTNGFSRLGHLLAGWKTDATATTATYAPKANISKALGVDGDTVTLYAHWDPIRYTLRYDLNGGSGNPPEEVHEFNKNFAIWNLVLPPSGADSLYCWSRASDSVVPAPNGYAPGVTTNNLSATDGEVVTLYAIWQLKDVEVAKGLVYDGSCQTGVVVKGGCQIVGNVATNAGEYTATVTPLPGFVWADGSTNATNVVWTIAKGTKDVSGVTLAGETRVAWDGAEKTLAVEGVPAGVTATPSWSAPPVEPDTYTLTVSFAPTDAANWNAIAETKTATLTITAPVAVPTAVSGLVYDGNLKTGVVAAADAVYALAGNTATTAGVYAATATLPSGYAWTGGSTAPTNVAWTIAKGTYDLSGVTFASKTVGWTGESQSLDPVAGLPAGVTAVYSGETNRADIGVSTAKVRFVVDDPANWNAVDLELTATLTVTMNLPVPTAVPGLVYDGGAKTGVVAGAGYTLTGNVATNAGTYAATATLEPNYFWADGSSEPTNVVWTIAKGTKDVGGVSFAGETRVAWDGAEKTLAVEGVPAGVTAIPSWSAPPVEPGTYTLTVSFAPTDAANWNAIAETKTATLTITAPVAVPTAVPGLVYDGTAKTGVVAAADAVYALAGNTATTAGVYAATATLPSGYAWTGGSTAPTNVAWTIAKGTYDMSGVAFASKTVGWTGESQSLDPVAGLPDGVTAVYSGETNRADIGVSTAKARFVVDDPANWNAVDLELTATLTVTANLPVPTAVPGLVYDGGAKTGVVAGAGYTLTGNVATNAGEYTATATLEPNYFWADGSSEPTNVVWTIAKGTKDVSGVMVAGETRVAWDGTEKTLAVEGVPAGVTATPSWSAPPVEPGTYTLTVSFAPTDAANWNAIAETKTATLTITAPVAVPTAVPGLVYDGTAKTGVVAAADAVYALAGNTATTAGVYAATATLRESGYAWAGGSTAPTNVAWTIAKGTYDLAGVTFASKTVAWTGESQSLDPVAGLPAGVTAVYSGETNRADIGVSTATARLTVDDPENWNAIDRELTATLTVTRNLPVPTAVLGLVYDGGAKTGVVAGAGYTLTGNVATNAGTYTATATLEPNYFWADGSSEPTNVVWTIAKGTKDVGGVTVAGETRVAWDGAEKTLAVAGVPTGVTATPSWSAPPVEPGTYTLTVSFAPTDAANWNAIAETKTATLTITAPVAVPTAVPGLVYDGTAKTGVVAAADAVYALSEHIAMNAGSYVATATLRESGYAWAGGLTAPTNVAWTIAKGTYDLTGVTFASKTNKYDGSVQTLDPVAGLPVGVTAVYSGEPSRRDVGVSTATVRFEVDDPANWNAIDLELTATLTVTGELPVPTAVPGLVYDGQAKTGVVAGVGYTLAGNVATNAGVYTATATLGDVYYWVGGSTEPTNVIWEIARGTKDVNGVTVQSPLTVPYDGREKTLTFGNLPSGVSASLSWDRQPVGPGEYHATVSFVADDPDNWTVVGGMEPVTLTITDSVAVPTAYDGLVYDGGAKTGVVVAADAVYALVGNVATNAGSYTATATLPAGYAWADGSTAPKNVAWTIAKGTYDLAGVTFASKTVGWTGESQSLDPVAGLPAGVTADYSGETNRTDVGVSTATARLTVDDPENWNAVDLELTATLTVTANLPVPTAVPNLVYDGGAKTGVVAGAGYTLAGNVATNAGTYAATATLEPNYFWADGASHPTNVTWTIARGRFDVQDVTFANAPLDYTGEALAPAIDGTLPPGVTMTFECATDRTSPGTHVVTVRFGADDNWELVGETRIVEMKIRSVIDVPNVADAFVYDGTAKTGVVAGVGYTLTGNVATNVGRYEVVATLLPGYEWSNKPGIKTEPWYADWVITKATYDMSGVTFESKTFDYDGQPHSLDPAGPLPPGLEAVYDGELGMTEAGERTVTASFKWDDQHTNNWNAIETTLTATLTIIQGGPVVTPGNWVPDGGDPVSYKGVYGVGLGNLAISLPSQGELVLEVRYAGDGSAEEEKFSVTPGQEGVVSDMSGSLKPDAGSNWKRLTIAVNKKGNLQFAYSYSDEFGNDTCWVRIVGWTPGGVQ